MHWGACIRMTVMARLDIIPALSREYWSCCINLKGKQDFNHEQLAQECARVSSLIEGHLLDTLRGNKPSGSACWALLVT